MTGIHPSAIVHPAAQISDDVTIGPYSICGENVSIGRGTTIGAHVVLDGWCRIGEHNTIYSGVVVGSPPQDLKYKGEKTKLTIGNHNVIREFVTLNIGTKGGGGETKLGDENLLMAYSHVAHDCIIGNRVVMANAATLGGHVVLEDGVIMSGLSGVHHFVRIGSLSIVGGCSKVLVDIPPYCMVDGHPAKVRGLNVIGLRRNNVPIETRNSLKEAYRLLYRSELNVDKALEKIVKEVPDSLEVRHVVEFVRETSRENPEEHCSQNRLMSKKIGLIAGSDRLPLVFAEEAKRCGEEVVAVAIEGYTSPKIEDKAKTYWIKPGELGKIIEIFRAEKIERAAMEGKIPQSIIFSDLEFDHSAKLILDKAKSGQTQSLLKGVADELKTHGITLVDARTHLDSVLAVKGSMTRRKPREGELADIEFGRNVLNVIGSLDIGQSVVVKNRAVLAIEAIEGTDAAIRRGAVLGKGGAVVVKMTKPGQDLRFDLPVVGEKTVAAMGEFGAEVLAIEASKTVILEKDETVRKADEENICIVAI